MKENRQELLKRYLNGTKRFLRQLSKILYSGLGYVFIGLGLFGQPWDRDRKKIEILFIACLAPLVIIPLGSAFKRHFLFSLPIFLLWMAKGLENLSIFIKNSFDLSIRKAFIVTGLVLILLILPTVGYLVYSTSALQKEKLPVEYRYMGSWMKGNIDDIENKIVISTPPYGAFYSGSRFVWIDFKETDYRKFIDTLKMRGGDYLIIDQRFVPVRFPHLKFLLDDQKKHSGLKKIHTIDNPQKIILYNLE